MAQHPLYKIKIFCELRSLSESIEICKGMITLTFDGNLIRSLQTLYPGAIWEKIDWQMGLWMTD